MALLIAVSLLLINNFVVPTTGTQTIPPKTELFSWYDNSGAYHFLAFSTNQFGQPVSGVYLQVNLTVSELLTRNGPVTDANVSSYPIYQGPLVSTNSSGEAAFTINVPVNKTNEVNANYSVVLYASQANGVSTTEGGYVEYYSESPSSSVSSKLSPIPPGQVVTVASGSPISTVTDPSNASKNDIQVIWTGASGLLPTHFSLYYKFINGTEVCTRVSNGESCHQAGNSAPTPLSSLNESNMQFLANVTSYHNIFQLPKLEANLTIDSEIVVTLFDANGSVASQAEFGVVDLYPQILPSTQASVTQNVSSFFLSVYGIFIPLIAVIVAYNSYGKYRLSGVLESVLAQPVSRRGLALSRFLSTFVAMAIAISISMIIVDFLVWSFTNSFVSSTTILASAGAFFVEVAILIAIMLLLSHVVRSSAALIGAGIGIFIVFDFFWALLVSLVVGLTHTSYGSPASYGYIVAGEFLNPAQFVGLVDAYLTHQVILVGLSLYTFPISTGQYGLTIPAIVVTGIIWITLPLAAFLYLAIEKD
jgi:ABC-type transport system involved in multi-copper enzyme maturation permease subunit